MKKTCLEYSYKRIDETALLLTLGVDFLVPQFYMFGFQADPITIYSMGRRYFHYAKAQNRTAYISAHGSYESLGPNRWTIKLMLFLCSTACGGVVYNLLVCIPSGC